MNNHAAIKGH